MLLQLRSNFILIAFCCHNNTLLLCSMHHNLHTSSGLRNHQLLLL